MTSTPSTIPSAQKAINPQKNNHFKGILKVLTLILVIINIISFLITTALLDKDNTYLSLLGIPENAGQKINAIQTIHQDLKDKIKQAKDEIQATEDQITNQQFYVHQDLIDHIEAQKRPWLTQKTSNSSLGWIDIPSALETYFNEGHFEHHVLFKSGNQLDIKSVHFHQDQATFTIHSSNFFGNIFLLSAQITQIINGLPDFYEGEILNYQRQQKGDGNDSMSFSLNVKIQTPEIEDPLDDNYSSRQFLNWALKR